MKIRCTANNGVSLPETYISAERGYSRDNEFSLTIGKEYIVYALYQWQNNIWYYICDDNYMYYPIKKPAPLFQIVDGRLSKYWKFHLAPNGLLEIAFDEWFSEDYFYDKLTDQEEVSVATFERVKELLDEEFVIEEQDYDLTRSSKKIIYKLESYTKSGGVFIEHCFIPTKVVSKLKYLFDLKKEEETLDIYTLSELQVDYIQDYVEHKIDLSQYDYFIIGSSN